MYKPIRDDDSVLEINKNQLFSESEINNIDYDLLFKNIYKYILPNGLTIVLKPDFRFPVCSMHAWVKTGSIFEGKYLGSGISHFLEHSLFLGTKKRPNEGQISYEIEMLGAADLNAHTSFEHTAYHFTVSSRFIDQGLDILNDMIFNSTLQKDRIEKEKKVILSEMEMGLDDPDTQMNYIFMENLYKNHPYKIPIIGYKDIFMETTNQILNDYYKEIYAPNNMVLTIVGDFNLDKITDKINKLFSSYKRQQDYHPIVPHENPQFIAENITEYLSIQKPRVKLAYKTCSVFEEESIALDLLSVILSSGKNSFFKKKYISTGLLNKVSAYSWTPLHKGFFEINALCNQDNYENISDEIRKDLDNLPSIINNDNLTEAKLKIFSDYINNLEATSGIAYNLASNEISTGSPTYDTYYLDKIKNLQKIDIIDTAKKYIEIPNETYITFLPKEYKKVSKAKEYQKDVNNIEQTFLDNKVMILLNKNKIPLINTAAVFCGGLEYENKENAGIFNIFSRMMIEGCKAYAREELHSLIEGKGGRISSFSGYNSFGLTLVYLNTQQKIISKVIKSILSQPKFLSKNFDIIKRNMLNELELQKENIWVQSELEFKKHFFEGTPFSMPKSGTIESINNITVNDLYQIFNSFIVSNNIIFSASGNCDKEMFSRQIGSIEKNEFKAGHISCDYKDLKYGGIKAVTIDKLQTVYRLAFRTSSIGHDDIKYLDLLNSYLSGMGGPIFQIREQTGHSYSVGTYHRPMKYTGAFVFYISLGTHAKVTDEWVLEQFQSIIYNIRKGKISEEEITRALNILTGSKDLELQASLNIVLNTALYELYGLGYNSYLTEYNFENSSPAYLKDKVVAIANKYFGRENFLFLKVGK